MAEKKSKAKAPAKDKKSKASEPLKLVKASARNLHVAPRKMRLVTNLLKKQHVEDALVQLQFANKKAAPILTKLIRSAIANADHNFNYKPETLYIASITCDMGTVMKRYFPRARGSAFVIRRKLSHVNLVLESRPNAARKNVNAAAIQKALETQDAHEEVTEAQGLPEQNQKIKATRVKSSEVVKANKVQNKRRLFNRKSGE